MAAVARPPALPSGSDAATGGLSLKGEVWRQLRRDRLASAGLVVLCVLLVTALLGRLLTEWLVLFDPTLVRLPVRDVQRRVRAGFPGDSRSVAETHEGLGQVLGAAPG